MSPVHVGRAVRALRRGRLVLHPTEGVWGLACDPFDREAVALLLALKNRPAAKGLILIGAGPEQFAPELEPLTAAQRARLLDTWPGPATWLVPNVRMPAWITGDSRNVAVRVPGHPEARALCAAWGGPLISTSANPAGRPPARSRLKARAYFPASIDCVLPGEVQDPGRASTIRSLDGVVVRA